MQQCQKSFLLFFGNFSEESDELFFFFTKNLELLVLDEELRKSYTERIANAF